jgi:hypothetical protein
MTVTSGQQFMRVRLPYSFVLPCSMVISLRILFILMLLAATAAFVFQAYDVAWKQLAKSAQLPASVILDLRGNHDVFDTVRNSPQDLFATHSATAAAFGRQAAATQRLWLTALPAQTLLPKQQQQQQQQNNQQQHSKRHHRGSIGERRQQRRLQLQGFGTGSSSNSTGTAVGKPQLASRQTLAADARAAAACPAALLLGLDLAPNVGLHSPSNFFGVAGPALLQQLQQRLQQLRSSSSSSSSDVGAALPPGCSNVPIISYSHYPFSTVAAAYGSSSGVVDWGGEPAVEGGRALRDMLCRYDVSAHLSGHLHDLLGPRMHVMYDKMQLLGGVFGRSKLRAAPPLLWQANEAGSSSSSAAAAAAGAAEGGGRVAFMADLEVGGTAVLLGGGLRLAC